MAPGKHPQTNMNSISAKSKILIIASISVLAFGCSREAPVADIDKASAQFFQRLNSADYSTIYDDADQSFKDQNAKATVQDDLLRFVSLGKPRDWERLKLMFSEEGKSRIATPVYTVHLGDKVSEVSLKLVDRDGEWKVLGFASKPRGSGPANQ